MIVNHALLTGYLRFNSNPANNACSGGSLHSRGLSNLGRTVLGHAGGARSSREERGARARNKHRALYITQASATQAILQATPLTRTVFLLPLEGRVIGVLLYLLSSVATYMASMEMD